MLCYSTVQYFKRGSQPSRHKGSYEHAEDSGLGRCPPPRTILATDSVKVGGRNSCPNAKRNELVLLQSDKL